MTDRRQYALHYCARTIERRRTVAREWKRARQREYWALWLIREVLNDYEWRPDGSQTGVRVPDAPRPG